ncbi:MAG: TRAP transporter small permease [Pseudomonadota bacterium]
MSQSSAGHPSANPQKRHPVSRVIGMLSTVSGVSAALMIVTAVALTCQMIWIRFVLNGSTIWQTEAVIYLMIGATLLGLPYVQKLRGHVNVDLLALVLPPRGRRVLALVTLALTIAVIAAMAFYGFEMWAIAFERGWTSDTVWGVKLWIPYLAMPVGFGLYLLQLCADLIDVLTGADDPLAAGHGAAAEESA